MRTDPQLLLPYAAGLRESFRAAGYTVDGVNARLGPVATAALGRGDLLPAIAALSADVSGGTDLDLLIRLFMLGAAAPADAAARLVPPAALVPAGDGLVRAGLDLRPHDDDWYVAADPSAPAPAADHVIGIGAASMTLLTATLRTPVQAALDVGTGCGVQALHLTRHACRVTATDVVPRALHMAQLSFLLSGHEAGGIELVPGDLLDPVAGRTFDLIVSNPPFVLAPPEPDSMAYRDAPGGDDAPLGRLLAGAAHALAPGGIAQVLTSWIVGAGGDWQQRVASMLPGGCDALVLLRDVLDPAEHVALWRDDDEPASPAIARGIRWLRHLSALGAAGIAYGLVVLRRTDAAPRVRLLDLTAEPAAPGGDRIESWLSRSELLRAHPEPGQLRLVRAPDLRLVESSVATGDGWQPTARHALCDSALPATVAVDTVTTALLAGCDGQLPLHAVADVLALASGAPAEGVQRVALELFATGHLVAAD